LRLISKFNCIVYLALLSILLSSCIAVKYHDYADLDKVFAVEIIQRLKSDTLLIVVPSFHKKETLLKYISRRGNKDRKNNKQRLLNLYAERQILQEALIKSFQNNYTFSSYLFIPDSLVYNLESGVKGKYFLDNGLKIDPSITYTNSNPIKLVQQFDQEWQIKIGNKIIPNPFPNYYVYRNGLYGFLGQEPYEKMYARVATTFQKRFDQFYNNPDRRIYL
jgi:hypothetical protein